MSGYTDTILQWATDSRRTGVLAEADGIGEIGLDSSEAGRRLAVRFTLRVELDKVADARYQVFGCGFSMAACAAAAELAIGRPLDGISHIDAGLLDSMLEGLPPERGYCAELAVAALHAAADSARCGQRPVTVELSGEAKHGPRVTRDHPVYRLLIDSQSPKSVPPEDRHLLACLLAVATSEPCDTAAALGLDRVDLDALLADFFPAINRSRLENYAPRSIASPPEPNMEILSLLKSQLPIGLESRVLLTSLRLAHILAARAVHPGHLWVAMGLTERPQLSAAIRRHLPSLAAANGRSRWNCQVKRNTVHGLPATTRSTGC